MYKIVRGLLREYIIEIDESDFYNVLYFRTRTDENDGIWERPTWRSNKQGNFCLGVNRDSGNELDLLEKFSELKVHKDWGDADFVDISEGDLVADFL